MSEWPVAELSDEVLDSLCELAELDDIDPVFNRKFVKTRVEQAIESYRWYENDWKERNTGAQNPFVKRLERAIELCEQLKVAVLDLPPEDLDFAFHDSGTQLNSGFLGEISELQERLEAIVDIRQPPRAAHRPERSDSRAFVEHLVETFYLVDGGRKSGRGCTKYRRLAEFLAVCIDQAAVPGSPSILNVNDGAWKHYVEPAITSTLVVLPKRRKSCEDLVRGLLEAEERLRHGPA